MKYPLTLLTAQLLVSLSGMATEPAPLSFNKDIRPILSDRCFACHGPDGEKRKAGLRLDTAEGATALLESGERAIVPGKSKESALFERIHSSDPKEIMPPAKLNRPLSEAERGFLTRWIDEGAVYAKHWAFSPPEKYPAPAVKDCAWAKDDIDRFILQKLEDQGLAPNAEADRAALLRRVSFVLTGLPPTPEQLAAFLRDPAPNAYEKQVDALLASPRYGERMALDWRTPMDISRTMAVSSGRGATG